MHCDIVIAPFRAGPLAGKRQKQSYRLVTRIGSRVFDGSIARHLDRIKQSLVEA